MVLTASLLFPAISGRAIVAIRLVGAALGLLLGLALAMRSHPAPAPVRVADVAAGVPPESGVTWQMPALTLLQQPLITRQGKAGSLAICLCLLVAFGLVVVKVAEMAVR